MTLKDIKTDRLVLTKPSLKYAKQIFNILKNQPTSDYICRKFKNTKFEDVTACIKKNQKDIRNKKEIIFVILYNNVVIGQINLFNINTRDKKLKIHYYISKEYQGNGFATEVLKAIINYCFKKLKYNKIGASVTEGNIPSSKLLIKCGFKLEGTLEKEYYNNKKYYDVLLYGLLKK